MYLLKHKDGSECRGTSVAVGHKVSTGHSVSLVKWLTSGRYVQLDEPLVYTSFHLTPVCLSTPATLSPGRYLCPEGM